MAGFLFDCKCTLTFTKMLLTVCRMAWAGGFLPFSDHMLSLGNTGETAPTALPLKGHEHRSALFYW